MMTLHSELLNSISGIQHAFQTQMAPPPNGLIHCHQVHSANVICLETHRLPNAASIPADGLVTNSHHPIGIQTADCMPVLFASKDGKSVAAIHAGWRGLQKGILIHAMRQFQEFGIAADQLYVAIGPSIGQCCFEVSSDVIDLFEKDWGFLWKGVDPPWQNQQIINTLKHRNQAPTSENNLWLNLEQIARLQLAFSVESFQIPSSQIEKVGHCTYCGPSDFASYRRNTHESPGAKAGRQWSWIGIQ